MPSSALGDLQLGLTEVRALREHAPRAEAGKTRSLTAAAASIAHRRACVVLLCSHYERFIYGLNDAAIDCVNAAAPMASVIPPEMLLRQIKDAVDTLGVVDWPHRGDKLRDLFARYSSHWVPGAGVALSPGPNLEWMKSPKVKDIGRFFRMYGIDDILRSVTRTDAGRRALTRELQGLVDARNGIAHGDQTTQPSRADVSRYLMKVEAFCTRADRAMAKRLAEMLGVDPPW